MAFLDIIGVDGSSVSSVRIGPDTTNTATLTVSATGDLTIAPTGGDTSVTGTLAVSGIATFSANVRAPTVQIENSATSYWLLGRDDTTGALVFNESGASDQMWLTTTGILQLGMSDTTGGVAKSFMIGNVASAPASNPVGGGILYAEAGAGKWRGSSGTVTTFGTAEPHCPECGADFMTEHENPKYGYLAVCLKCLADEIGDRPFILREKIAA